MARSRTAGGALLVVLALPAVAGGQEVPRTPVRCNGQTVTDIVIRTQGPSFGGIFERSTGLIGLVRRLHVTTAPDVIRRFVLLQKGQPCSPIRANETERILRAQPFLAAASVTTYPDAVSGGVRVEVVTVDELSPVAGVGVANHEPYLTGLTLGSQNLGGNGIYAAADWRDGGFYRDHFGAAFTMYQFLGRPWVLELVGDRNSLGSEWVTDMSHPFFSDVQRAAWRMSAGGSRTFFPFVRPGGDRLAVMLERTYADAGLIVRVGAPGRLSLFGFSISRESADPAGSAVVVSDSGVLSDTTTALIDRYRRLRTARANWLWGIRNTEFMRVEGFDALTGVQDVRTGFQLGTLFGRSLRSLGALDDDIFVSADIYAGAGTPSGFGAIELRGEGRQSYDENRWDDILASGRLAWYMRAARRRTTIASVEYSGGWRQRTPFQLDLGASRGGMLGYRDGDLPGARRGIARLEQRWVLGNVRGNADAGTALFVEAGKMWRGDVPFGASTPVRYAAGVSVLAGIPPRSQRLWRLDLAMPLAGKAAGGGRLQVRLTSEDRTRTFWTEPPDLARSRERSLPTQIFTWP